MKMPSTSGGGGNTSKQSWPPGFRFHPTDEELVLYYLKRKVCGKRLKLDIIAETDVYKWDPDDLPELSKLKTGDRLWFFFSPRDRKYPNGGRSNRATHHGYWKATGRDRQITCNSRYVGLKKTLVFYQGRAPSGTRTDWVMHEYTLAEEELKRCKNVADYYALYKVYKKSGPGPKNGEQYGAPFKEEDWADEECTEVGFNTVEVANLPEPSELQTSDMTSLADKLIYSADETEGMWNSSGEIAQSAEFADSFNQRFEDETKSRNYDPSKQGLVLHSVSQQFDMSGGFDFSQSAASEIVDVPDITSGLTIDELHNILDDGDFLEANDLFGPEPIPSSEENPFENILFDDTYDGLGEWDLFDDASMFLRDDGANDPNLMFNEDDNMLNKLDYQEQPQLGNACVVTDDLWGADALYENRSSGVYSGFLNDGSTSNTGSLNGGSTSITGSLNGGSTSITGQQEFQNHNGSTSHPQSRVTSALWAFVESIPTTPASASENFMFNHAMERVSSFRKTRLNGINALTTAGTKDTVKVNKSRGILIISIVGAVFAMLWILVSRKTAISVL